MVSLLIQMIKPKTWESSFSLSHPHDSPLRLQAAFGGWGPTLQLIKAGSMLGLGGWGGQSLFSRLPGEWFLFPGLTAGVDTLAAWMGLWEDKHRSWPPATGSLSTTEDPCSPGQAPSLGLSFLVSMALTKSE